MKQGQRPIHIMRWAPADFVNDPFVKLLAAKRDYRTLTVYQFVLWWCHIEGGDLPPDRAELAAVLGLPRTDVAKAVARCIKAGKLFEGDGRLFHRRVKREVEEELTFRSEQAELGKKGAYKRWHGEAYGPPIQPGYSPPLPIPLPPPLPLPLPAPSSAPDPMAKPANRLVNREASLREAYALIREIAPKADLDPTEVLAKASEWEGRGKVRLDSASDDRIAHTLIRLRQWGRKLRGEAEPEIPEAPTRGSPPSARDERIRKREDVLRAAVLGGLKGDGTLGGGHDGRGLDAGDGGTAAGVPGTRAGPGTGGGAGLALPPAPGRSGG